MIEVKLLQDVIEVFYPDSTKIDSVYAYYVTSIEDVLELNKKYSAITFDFIPKHQYIHFVFPDWILVSVLKNPASVTYARLSYTYERATKVINFIDDLEDMK